jgi:LysM repeat protein
VSREDVAPQVPATDDVDSVCPYLGMVGDSGSRLTFPSRTHLCHAGQPAHIGLGFQADFCLGGGYADCARYQRAAAKGVAPAAPAAVATLLVASSGERLFIRDREGTSMSSRLVTLMLGLALVGTLVALGIVLGIISLPDGTPITGGPTPTPSLSPPPTNAATGQPTGSPTTAPTASPSPSPQPTPAPTPTPDHVLHVIQPGETLTAIAIRYGVTVEAIVVANGITDPNHIQAGDVLIIPLGDAASPTPGPSATPAPTASGSPEVTIYVVQAGDTLQRIANRFGVTVQAIQEANGITDPNKIYVGQQLIIPPPP